MAIKLLRTRMTRNYFRRLNLTPSVRDFIRERRLTRIYYERHNYYILYISRGHIYQSLQMMDTDRRSPKHITMTEGQQTTILYSKAFFRNKNQNSCFIAAQS